MIMVCYQYIYYMYYTFYHDKMLQVHTANPPDNPLDCTHFLLLSLHQNTPRVDMVC